MNFVEKKIDVITHHTTTGEMRPIRFQITLEDETKKAFNIDQILKVNKLKKNRKLIRLYTCKTMINDTLRVFELKYYVSEHRWELYKI